MPKILAASLLLFAMLSPGRIISEEVEAPLYTNWSKFPIGTMVTQKMTLSQKGTTVVTITVTKLETKSEKDLIISKVVTSDGTGSATTNDPIITTVRRMFPLLPGVDKTKIGRPQGTQASGMEIIELLGKKYNAEWYDTKSQTEAGPSMTRTWISMEVPNMILKSETEVKVANKKVSIEITEIKIP